LYEATAAQPGTFKSMIRGTVDRRWPLAVGRWPWDGDDATGRDRGGLRAGAWSRPSPRHGVSNTCGASLLHATSPTSRRSRTSSATALEHFKKITILVNNAGGGGPKPFDMPMSDFVWAYQLNVFPAFPLMQLCAPQQRHTSAVRSRPGLI